LSNFGKPCRSPELRRARSAALDAYAEAVPARSATGDDPDGALRMAVIADDLTGAADAGLQLVRAGHRTGVAFWEASLPPAQELDAVVADTDSRGLAPADAAARVASAARVLGDVPIVLKKIDSTLRGPIGAELRAALEGSGRTRMIVAPAFPAAGRTTRAGVQYLNGERVDSAMSAPEADLSRLLEGAGFADVAVVSRARDVASAVRRHACVVADAADDADLAELVGGVELSEVLWVGSAGLAAALGAARPGRHRSTAARPTAQAVLVVIGTASATARTQVEQLLAAGDVVDVPLALYEDEAVCAAATAAADGLASAGCAVVHTTTHESPTGEARRRIPAALAAVVARVAAEGVVGGLVLSGGETAIHVARALGASGLLIEDQVEAGVPVSRLIGPRPCWVVSKAGGFGGPATLVDAVAALGGRVGDPR
jgi:D-threonate/D-erythronate kinase